MCFCVVPIPEEFATHPYFQCNPIFLRNYKRILRRLVLTHYLAPTNHSMLELERLVNSVHAMITKGVCFEHVQGNVGMQSLHWPPSKVCAFNCYHYSEPVTMLLHMQGSRLVKHNIKDGQVEMWRA